MKEPRIAPLAAPFEQPVADTFARYLPPGMEALHLFGTQAHNPRVLQRVFAGNLLDAGSIDQRTRELVILRTCARCACEYEWGVHVALFAKAAGLTEADIAATLVPAGSDAGLPEQEAWLLQAVDALHDTATLPDDLWTALSGMFSNEQILEILALAGYYHTIAFTANATKVQLEAFAPRFPCSLAA
jgi:alkylhydroperoxidase family enzyme